MASESTSSMSFMDLNDDCIEYICTFLDVPDQYAMKKVSWRLEEIIVGMWRRGSRNLTVSDRLLAKDPVSKYKLFDTFMTAVSPTVERMRLDVISVKQMRAVHHLSFPRVRVLAAHFSYNRDNDDDNYNDEDTRLIGRLFPALCKLTLLSTATGKYLWQLKHLVDLDLSACEGLNVDHFDRIFSTLKLRKFTLLYYGYNTLLDEGINTITKCETLQELHIDDHHLMIFIDDLLCMPNMRRLICFTRDHADHLLDKITDKHGDRMHKLIFNNVMWSKGRTGQMAKMRNLRTLILHNDFSLMKDDDLRLVAGCLENLRELHIIRGRVQSEYGMSHFFEQCEFLKVLNVSRTRFSPLLLHYAVSTLETARKRQFPLTLYCSGTGISPASVQKLQAHPAIVRVIINDSPKVLLPYAHCFQCDWDTGFDESKSAAQDERRDHVSPEVYKRRCKRV